MERETNRSFGGEEQRYRRTSSKAQKRCAEGNVPTSHLLRFDAAMILRNAPAGQQDRKKVRKGCWKHSHIGHAFAAEHENRNPFDHRRANV